MMKRLLLFLATEKGYNVLKALAYSGMDRTIGGVISFRESGVEGSYFDTIKELSQSLNIRFFEWAEVRNRLSEIVIMEEITNCIVVSWRYLLPLELNRFLDEPIIVFHDSLLPKYRGFAPVVTAMINGDSRIGATVFFATEKADCGEIILQKAFDISKDMYIAEVINRMSLLYGELAIELVSKLIRGDMGHFKQDESEVSYSIWRDEEDYWIDWNHSAEYLNRFIHATGFPYRGAKTRDADSVIRVLKSEVEPQDLSFVIRSPGKIWSLNGGTPTVVCGEGMLRITEAKSEDGNVYSFKKLRTRLR